MITVIINAHAEGEWLAHAIESAIASKFSLQSSFDVPVEILVILDRPDHETRSIARKFDSVMPTEVDFGDLSLSRNFGVEVSKFPFIAFLDGDDLWSNNWLKSCYEYFLEAGLYQDLILHPELSLYFGENTLCTVKAIKHPNSTDHHFDSDGLVFRNFWTALSFGKRETYLRHKFMPHDKSLLFGFEDWAFNRTTLSLGIQHVTVPETVHFLRTKASGSLLRESAKIGLIPPPY